MNKNNENNQESSNYNNTRDFIIKLILLIIIIILLIHNCSLSKSINKDDKVQKPNGNVDIFNIQCYSDKCNNPSYSSDNKKSDDAYATNSSKHYSRPNSNNASQSNKTDGDKPSGGADEQTDEGNLTVLDDDITWKSTNNLRIFSNPVFDMKNIIEPESSNAYQFVILNNTQYNLSYNISFFEENDYNINMKYKLKRDGVYIAGDDDTWVSYSELNKLNIPLDSSKSHTYYLDWKWVGSDNDTIAGANSAEYELSIEIKASQKNG